MFIDVLEMITSFFAQYQGLIIRLSIAILAFIILKNATKTLKEHLLKTSEKPEDIQSFFMYLNYFWMFIILAFLFISFAGAITFGISAAFLTMIIGWSLQKPVTGIAAWLLVITMKPFKLGNRIIIAGIKGEVKEINLFHITLEQVGGTVSGEEKSGRGAKIPTAILFDQILYTYEYEGEYVRYEIVVRITFESNLEEAKQILINEAVSTRDVLVIKKRGNPNELDEPFVRSQFIPDGLYMYLRYQTLAKEKERVASDITEGIFQKIQKSNSVEFALPHMDIVHSAKESSIVVEDGEVETTPDTDSE